MIYSILWLKLPLTWTEEKSVWSGTKSQFSSSAGREVVFVANTNIGLNPWTRYIVPYSQIRNSRWWGTTFDPNWRFLLNNESSFNTKIVWRKKWGEYWPQHTRRASTITITIYAMVEDHHSFKVDCCSTTRQITILHHHLINTKWEIKCMDGQFKK